ncbi:MAG: hypothetical protein A2Z12_02625 [Actinobacteria bacterium RBG_16_68_21]|nr:MAG: hypothetical protein A2Z12_02625 [Actinobacteria bacterium RBG_16_68_21]
MLLLVLALLFPGPCLLSLPADGPVVRGFAPEGLYGGHWGIDIAVDLATPVRTAASGVVTFSGNVAGNETVTVHHGGGVRTSYSYLTARYVTTGQAVAAGTILGASGRDHGIESVHFSLRLGARYADPLSSCGTVGPPSAALRLAPTFATYPVSRAPRSSRRDI